MSLRKLIKQNAKTVMGVDSSTNSFAFCVLGEGPVKWGKVNFNGNNLSITNLVSNTGVVATDTTGVGTARYNLAAASYSS